MRTFIGPRLRKPLAIGLAGLVFGAAWLVRGGPTTWIAILAVVAAAARAAAVYVRAGRDTEEGALAGSRGDERQQLVSQRSWALAGQVAVLAAFAGLTAAVAARAGWWWLCAVMLGVTGLAYLLGLSSYGVGEEGPAEDADAGYQERSPVSP